MTRTTNARLAGFMFLFYIATAFPGMVLFERATRGVGTAERLANIAQHAPQMRLVVLLSLVTIFDAIVLAVALYAITRDADRDLAVLALCCRVGEGVVGAFSTVVPLGLLSVAAGAAGAAGADAAAANALGALLLKAQDWSVGIAATLFAVGSTLFSYLFLRARSIPVPLAWLGIFASILDLVVLPLQLAGYIKGPLPLLFWMPMLVFEVTLALWLLIKGVSPAATR
ncbi:MAG TPA: DUF4386 domain-containing protein [Thermoanaerobaculia bacterium]|jgi:hypothetical protein|nr:DUF4386 domain-containing protein [Thermoanaerobaculia bacterium]